MKTPPLGASSTAVWASFLAWAKEHQVPDAEEEWTYLWEMYLHAFADGMKEGLAELASAQETANKLIDNAFLVATAR